jgi:hypothetical protein
LCGMPNPATISAISYCPLREREPAKNLRRSRPFLGRWKISERRS